MSNFHEYITTLESVQALAETVECLDRLRNETFDKLCCIARSKDMYWLVRMSSTQIKVEHQIALLRHYERFEQNKVKAQ